MCRIKVLFSVAALVSFTLLSPLSVAQQFISAAHYKTGTEPYLPVVADFNVDGKLDVAVLDGPGFSVLLGNGDGSFQAPKERVANHGSAEADDFNMDGKPDLALVDPNAGTVQLFIGAGDGTFQLRSTTPTHHPQEVAAGDLNGDGKPDLVTSVSAVYDDTLAVNVLIGKGDGTFETPVEYAVGSASVWVQVADINGDGKQDVVSVDWVPRVAKTISFLAGNGDGTLRAAIESSVDAQPYTAALGDFNGDGKLDVAVVDNEHDSITIASGRGDGTFQSVGLFSTGDTPQAVISADFNHDGKLDLATTNLREEAISVRLGNGDGTFKPRSDYSTGPSPYNLAVADFDRDGKLDIVVPNRLSNPGVDRGFLAVLFGNGDGTFRNNDVFEMKDLVTSVAAGDFNNDGRPDLAVAVISFEHHVLVMLANSNGTFSTPTSFPTAGPSYEAATGDFNSDGKLDIVTSAYVGGGLSVLLGNGDGTFQPYSEVPISIFAERMVPADFNNDGKLDIAVLDRIKAGVLLGNGDGTFKPPIFYRDLGKSLQLAVGDVNADGNLDMVVADLEVVSVLLGNGDGTFQPKIDSAVAFGIQGVALADFNEDGTLDAVITHKHGNFKRDVEILLGSGDGTFQAGTGAPAQPSAGYTILADLNWDGHVDVITNDYSSSLLGVFLGRGDGTLGKMQVYSPGPYPTELVAADFNQDGYPDLAAANFGTFKGSVGVLSNNGSARLGLSVDF